MSILQNKIDFVALVSVTRANGNGDPLNGNRPRTDLNGFGEISDVCVKRKIRNRMQDMGNPIFVQSEDRCTDGFGSLSERATAGLKGMANLAHYSAAKHGLVGMARSLANELAPHRIRVNTVHPTNVDTVMIQNTATKALFGGPDISREEFAEAATPMNMLPVPWVDVDDITEALMYLSSEAGRFITGVSLPVDAGMSQK